MKEVAAALERPVFSKKPPKSVLEANTRTGQVYWCNFDNIAMLPEFDAPHLVVVLRGGDRDAGPHLVVPLTKIPQTGQFGYQLKINPNPRSAPEAWAVCDHIYTVSSGRLEPLRDDDHQPRRNVTVDPEDLVEIGRRVFASLNTLRRLTFGKQQTPDASPDKGG